jgi:hypothetical protein
MLLVTVYSAAWSQNNDAPRASRPFGVGDRHGTGHRMFHRDWVARAVAVGFSAQRSLRRC